MKLQPTKKVLPDTTLISLTNKSAKQQVTKPTPTSNSSFLYEPCKFSTRLIRAWQQQTGQNWHQLSPRSRVRANTELEVMQRGVQANLAASGKTSASMWKFSVK
jgi:hypothetical protein